MTGDSRVTATGLVLGSPDYIAPEQAREGAGAAPADLWGLGAALYFAVEGVPPFQRGEPLATMHAALHDEPRPCQHAGALEPVLAAMLTKDPARRPAIAEVRRRLHAAADDAQPDPSPRAVTSRTRPIETPPPWWRRPTAAMAAVVLMALGAVSAAAALLDGTPDDQEPAEQDAPDPGQDPDQEQAPDPGQEPTPPPTRHRPRRRPPRTRTRPARRPRPPTSPSSG